MNNLSVKEDTIRTVTKGVIYGFITNGCGVDLGAFRYEDLELNNMLSYYSGPPYNLMRDIKNHAKELNMPPVFVDIMIKRIVKIMKIK